MRRARSSHKRYFEIPALEYLAESFMRLGYFRSGNTEIAKCHMKQKILVFSVYCKIRLRYARSILANSFSSCFDTLNCILLMRWDH